MPTPTNTPHAASWARRPFARDPHQEEADGQNRADAKRQILDDQQWKTVQEEDQQNRQLLELSNQILELTKAVHAYVRPPAADGSNGADTAGADGQC